MSKTNSNTSSSNISPTILSFTAKFRRLKIEESVLLQNLHKSVSTNSQSDIELDQYNYHMFDEFIKFCAKSRDSYIELNRLFQDIKASTSMETVKSLDIDEIKKCTHELEKNIKSYKLYLYTEINALKLAEKQLNLELNGPILASNFRRKLRLQNAKYIDIVPSPVKTLMTSPFKCSEVQEFQEFMKLSKNQYGGWDEFQHNIFANVWQKHFGAKNLTKETVLDKIKKSAELNLFIRELTPKLLGLSEEEVLSHVKWYTKYLQLKNRQQNAIVKWRSNRKMMKISNEKGDSDNNRKMKNRCVKKTKHVNRDDELNLNNIMDYFSPLEDQIQPKVETCRSSRKCLCMDLISKNSLKEYKNADKQYLHFLKSTMQWNIRRCSIKSMSETGFSDVENIKKLGTPLWRAGL